MKFLKHKHGNDDRLDWFPVWLDLSEPLASYPPATPYSYRLTSDGEALNVIATSLERQEADSYQTTIVSSFGSGYRQTLAWAVASPVDSGGFLLPPDFLSLVSTNNVMGVILVEGRRRSTEPLFLEIRDSENDVVARVQLPLAVSSVEDMFRFLNLRPVTDGSGSPSTRTNEPPNRPYVPNGKNVFFLHGFLVGRNESRGWGEEKRGQTLIIFAPEGGGGDRPRFSHIFRIRE